MFPSPHAPNCQTGRIAAIFPCLIATLAFSALPILAGEEKERAKPATEAPAPPSGEITPRDPFHGIPPEKRERLRETMRKIWDDSAVLQARGEVAAATENYQKALRAAVERTDPEMLAVIETIRASSKSEFKGFLEKVGPHRGGPGGRDFRDPFAAILEAPPPFVKDLTEEQREIYKTARQKAIQSPAFQQVRKEWEAVRKKDEQLREERIRLFRRVWQILSQEMLRADERVKDWLPSPPSGPPGKDKGKRFPGKGRGHDDLPKPPTPESPTAEN